MIISKSPLLFRHYQIETFRGIEIVGGAGFCARSLEALDRLSSQAAFETVERYLARVAQGARSGVRPWAIPPTFVVGGPTWRHSVLWYAGAIAHDAYHAKLYQQARSASGEPPDLRAWTGREAEKRCLKFQLQTLEGLKADAGTLTYLEQLLLNPTYASERGGIRGWLDYLNRWW